MKYDKKIDKPLGQILMERGVINNAQLQEAVESQKREGGLIGEVIVGLGFAKEEDIAYCLSLQFGYPYLPLYNYEISDEVTNIIPKNVCMHYCLIPIDKIGNTLTIAMSNPLNVQAIEDLEEIIHCDIQIFVSTPSDIRKSIDKFYK
jgi:type IV pilus assembly protein PilB